MALPGWLAGPSLALVCVAVMSIWHYIGFNVVIYLAGLGGISRELYEAARMDGANEWQVFRRITLPLLSPTTFFLATVSTIGALQAFNTIYVMTNGGPLDTTRTVLLLVFKTFYQQTRVGYGSAIAFVLTFMILGLTCSTCASSAGACTTTDRRSGIGSRADRDRDQGPGPGSGPGQGGEGFAAGVIRVSATVREPHGADGTPIPVAGPPGTSAPAIGPAAAAAAGPAERAVQAPIDARRSPLARFGIHLVLVVGALVSFFPFYWMVTSSFKTNIQAIASPLLGADGVAPGELRHRPKSAAASRATSSTPCWSPSARWWACSSSHPGRLRVRADGVLRQERLFGIFLATLMIPSEVTLIPNFVIITRWFGWYDTYQAQFVTGLGSVFAIFMLRQFFMTIPKELEDAAMMDGCSACGSCGPSWCLSRGRR